jgi:pimeloyl-ACP methyl ester carboxylesterase
MRKNIVTILFFLFFSSSFQLFAQDQFFESNGVKIRYITKGSGVPVVLIHGMTQNIENCWAGPAEGGNLIERLSKNHQVIALDCRGHGKSDKPHDSTQYGILMVKDVVNLLDYLHINKAHIIGFSMGAIIAGNLQLNYPDRVLSTVLSSALIDTKKGNEESGVQYAMKSTALDIDNGRGMYSMIKWLDLPQDNHPAISDEQALGIGRFLIQNNDPVAIVSVLKAFDEFDVKEKQLEQNKIPTLVIVGTQDHSIIAARQHIQHFKSARLKEIPGKEHAGILDSKEYYNAVEEFINERKIP